MVAILLPMTGEKGRWIHRWTRQRARNRASARFIDFLKDPKTLALNVTAGASLLIAVWVRVVFADTSTTAWLDDAANLLSDICVGYFPAWFTYYLASWRPRRQDRDRALLNVGWTAIQVAGVAQSLLRHLRSAAGNPGSGAISQKHLAEMVTGLNIYSEVPSIVDWTDHKPLNVMAVFQDAIQRSDDSVAQCMRLSIFLDSELLAALQAIQACSFFQTVRRLPPNITADVNVFVPEIYEYFMLCDDLRALLYQDYRQVLGRIPNLDVESVATEKVTDGALAWRPGSARPADWNI